MNEIEWTKKAIKQMRRIDKRSYKGILVAVNGLKNWPECQNVKHLINHRYSYRLRVGSYRVFFDAKTTLKIIKIEEVKKRDESTY